MQKFRHYWEFVRTSYWFLPTLMCVAAVVLSAVSIQLDDWIQEPWLDGTGWLYTGGPEGARQLLAALAGSMVTVAGVVFSVTVVALSMASSQFGPRLLRNFMRDRGSQVVLGTFISTFFYCLLVLRTVRGQDDSEFVPHVSVTIAVLLAIASIGVLIYFIHHAAVMMQAPQVTANVSAELNASIETLFPEELGEGAESEEIALDRTDFPDDFDVRAHRVSAATDGYIQLIDDDQLMNLAEKHDLRVRLSQRPGDFVVRGGALLFVLPSEVSDEMDRDLREAFVLGPQQTPTQDVKFAVNQLVEVAVRALSPGINDPFTAMSCVDRLGAALCRLARRSIPSRHRCDKHGSVRVIAEPPSFGEVVDAAFTQIRQYGRTSSAVLTRMLQVIGNAYDNARRAEDREALLRQARLIQQTAEQLPLEADRQDVLRWCRGLLN